MKIVNKKRSANLPIVVTGDVMDTLELSVMFKLGELEDEFKFPNVEFNRE